MKKLLKDVRYILTLFLILTWVAVGVGAYIYHNSNQKVLVEKEQKIQDLEFSIEQIGELVPAFTVASDVKTGKRIEETDLVETFVPLSIATNVITDRSELVGKYYKVDITGGTTLTYDVIYEQEITDDLRLLDVVLHNIPIGLQAGDFVDIRITLPHGEDFIAMAHKKVHDIVGGIIKIEVTENDIHTYNSMLVDSFLYTGTNMYAVQYLEGGSQAAADTYYPLSTNVLAIAQKDPNLLQAIKSDILQRRIALEENLTGVLPEEEIYKAIEKGRENLRGSMYDAEVELQKRLKEIAKQEGGSGTTSGTVEVIGD